jgi:hypothetical protein
MKSFFCTYHHPDSSSMCGKTSSLVLQIAMAKNPKLTPQTKHIALKYHHFWKHVITQANLNGFISLESCSTHDQIADIFTKPVRDDIFFELRKGLLGW